MRNVVLGGTYKHFKGGLYRVVLIAKHTETQEDLVVYSELGTSQYFARPYDMFLSEVDHEKYPEVKQLHRLELL